MQGMDDKINRQMIRDCFLILAICHTIVSDIKDGQYIYNSTSPDELALVNFAKFCGYEFMEVGDNNIINIKIDGV